MEVFRLCLVSRIKKERNQLFRIVKTSEGKVIIDLSYNIQGRGAYISKDVNLINKAKKKDLLSRSLHTKIDKSIYDELLALVKGD